MRGKPQSPVMQLLDQILVKKISTDCTENRFDKRFSSQRCADRASSVEFPRLSFFRRGPPVTLVRLFRKFRFQTLESRGSPPPPELLVVVLSELLGDLPNWAYTLSVHLLG